MENQEFEALKVGFVGGGNMARAIGAGLIRKGILNPNNVWVSAKTDRTSAFWKKLGVHFTLRNEDVLLNCKTIFLAMKPHMYVEVLNGIQKAIDKPFKDKLFVSVLVGVPLQTLILGLKTIAVEPRIIRSMPNTPMMVGEGVTVYCDFNTKEHDLEIVESLLSYTGICERVPEALMNPIGGLSGSGPAYAYLVLEALADGAVKMGVPRIMATEYAARVLIGAGRMVLETGKHPGQLKDEVCSPGGSTINGIHALENGRVRASMADAVEAAVRKAEEISTSIK